MFEQAPYERFARIFVRPIVLARVGPPLPRRRLHVTLGFAAALGSEAVYDAYDGASCNSLEAKSVPPPCRADRSGVSLPYAPDWTFSFNPDYRVMVGSNYELIVGANIRFSDGYWISDNEDPRNEVGSFERVDLRVG